MEEGVTSSPIVVVDEFAHFVRNNVFLSWNPVEMECDPVRPAEVVDLYREFLKVLLLTSFLRD